MEKKKGYYDRCYDLKKEIIETLCDILGENEVDLSESNIDVSAVEHHSAEGIWGKIVSISRKGFVLQWDTNRLPLKDMCLEDLGYILDLLDEDRI